MSRVGNGQQQYKKKNRFKMKDGDVVFRILPPFSEINKLFPSLGLPDNNAWSRFHSVHFGYKNEQNKMHVFESPLVKNHKTKMIDVPDAALDRINDLKAKLEESRMNLNGALTAKLNSLVGMMGVYSVDNNHHMNVVDLQGNIGEFKIRYKAKLALDAEIKTLEAEGVDPLSLDNGRFFVFSRSEKGTDTTFKVKVYTEKLDIQGVGKVDRQVVSKINLDILNRLKTEASDLDKVAVKLTAEEVKQIVDASDLMTGKSSAVDAIFAKYKTKPAAANNATTRVTETQAPNEDVGPTNGSSFANEQRVTLPVGATSATITAAPSQPTAAVTVATQPTGAVITQASTPTTTAQVVEDMSDEEFFKQIGVPASA